MNNDMFGLGISVEEELNLIEQLIENNYDVKVIATFVEELISKKEELLN